MGLRDLERRIERGVDGVLGRVFRSDLSRIEIDKRVERELDAGRRRRPGGDAIMPNDIEVRLHPDDAAAFTGDTAELERDLLVLAREHARDAECAFEGPLVVKVKATDESRKGSIVVVARSEQSVDGIPPGTLVHPDGERFDLVVAGTDGVRIGRDEGAHITIDDKLASRQHATVRPSARGWIVEDLTSTNGTRVNGFRTTAQLLTDGDHITIGDTTLVFDAS